MLECLQLATHNTFIFIQLLQCDMSGIYVPATPVAAPEVVHVHLENFLVSNEAKHSFLRKYVTIEKQPKP